MDIKQLEVFVSVLDQGSFSGAGKMLYLSQPTVSAHVKALEKEFGVKLIERTTRSVTATTAGKRLYIYAREMLNVTEKIHTDELLHGIVVRGADTVDSEGLSGAIRIAATSVPAHYLLPSAMSAFQKKNPDVRFHIITGDSERAQRLVITQQVDFALIGALLPHMDCQFTKLSEDELVVVTPNTPAFQSLCSGGFPAQELMNYPFITREEGSGTREETFRFLKKFGVNTRRLNISMEVADIELIKQSVAQGLGISILSRRSIGDFTQFGILLASPLREGPMLRPIYLTQHHQVSFSPQAEAFAQFLLSSAPQS